jgi:TRAP-type mannitol/chloroaromatic compound transport system permease large subunit
METSVYFVFALFILAAVGMPIAFVITLTAVLMFLAVGNLKMMAVAQNMVGGVDSFILMAVPLFILAGKVMNSGKVTDRIFNFASALVGHIKGGLGHERPGQSDLRGHLGVGGGGCRWPR